jgi:CRISPR-associated protein Csm2
MNVINESNYVDKAESAIKALGSPKNSNGSDRPSNSNNSQGELSFDFTTTQLRKLLSMSAELFDIAKGEAEETISERLKSKLNQLRVQIVYQAGRKREEVRPFVEEAKLLEIMGEIGDRRENVLLFCRYMEALVAWHKYHGGEDNK